MKDRKRGYRVVTNPEAENQDVKIYPGESWAGGDVQRLMDLETAQPGALLYSLEDYEQLVLFLGNTKEVKDVQDVRFCAAGRGYIKYLRKPGGAALPPEDALIKLLESAPSLPRPESASVTIRQDQQHPEGYIVKDHAEGAAAVDRFIDAYMALGGAFGGLVSQLERLARGMR